MLGQPENSVGIKDITNDVIIHCRMTLSRHYPLGGAYNINSWQNQIVEMVGPHARIQEERETEAGQASRRS